MNSIDKGEGDSRQSGFTRTGAGLDNSIVFMFPGLGDHYLNMGKGLYSSEPEFRKQIDNCRDIAAPLLDIDLKTVLYGHDKASADTLNRTIFAHPCIFMVEYALARMWIEKGIRPDALIGLSLGEYTAACLSGVVSLEDTMGILIKRAQLIEELPEGAMLATLMSEAEINPLLGNDLGIGVMGTPFSSMISGSLDAIAGLEKKLEAEHAVFIRIQVNHAFHSKKMAPIGTEFSKFLKTISFNKPGIPYISNVTGSWITDEQAMTPTYWFDHICKTVRFADGIGELLKLPRPVFLEVGPGKGLTSFVYQHPGVADLPAVSVIQSLPDKALNQSDDMFLKERTAELQKMAGTGWGEK